MFNLTFASTMAQVAVGLVCVLALVQVSRSRDRHRESKPHRARLLTLFALTWLAILLIAGAAVPLDAGWVDLAALFGTGCLVSGLAAREGRFREALAERDQAEGQVASQQRLLRTTFDAIPHVMAVKDSNADLLMVNKAFCELTGADPSGVRGIRVADIASISSEDAAPVDPEDQLILSGAKEIVETDRQHATQDGALRDYHVVKVPLRDERGRLDGLVVIGLDVTERKAAERALADNQRLLREVFDAIPHLVAVKDREGRYLILNQSYTYTFGLGQESAVGRTPLQIASGHEDDMQQIVEDDRRVLGGETSRYTVERWRHDQAGERLLIEITEAPLHDAHGDIAGVVSVGIDVTERRRIQDELATYRDRLEERVAERTYELEAAQNELLRSERLAALGRLTATVSHELRNPLGTISASCQAVRRRVPGTDPRIVAIMDRIERNVRRCVKIIDDLLFYARTPAISTERTQIDDWVGEVCSTIEIPPSIRLTVKPGSSAWGDVDRGQLGQAVVNLVHNACQSMVEAAASGESEETATLEVATRLAGERLEIRVQDSGPGISEDVIEHVFEPLYSTRNFGVGLGLPLAKQIAERHGGGIEMQSTPGRGTVATLWLPSGRRAAS